VLSHDQRGSLRTALYIRCESSPTDMQTDNTTFSVVALVMAAAGGEFSLSDP